MNSTTLLKQKHVKKEKNKKFSNQPFVTFRLSKSFSEDRVEAWDIHSMLLERFIQRLELETSLIGRMFPGTVAGTFHQVKGKRGL